MAANPHHLVEAFVAMLNERDPDIVDRFVAADYINHNVFVPDGREANRTFWARFFAAVPDLTATVEDVVVSGDRVVGRFAYRGTHAGEFSAEFKADMKGFDPQDVVAVCTMLLDATRSSPIR